MGKHALTVRELIEALEQVDDKDKLVQIIAWQDTGHPNIASKDDVMEGDRLHAPIQEFDDYVGIVRTP